MKKLYWKRPLLEMSQTRILDLVQPLTTYLPTYQLRLVRQVLMEQRDNHLCRWSYICFNTLPPSHSRFENIFLSR